MVPRNSPQGSFANICQSKRAGIIATKTERTQIHFLSDVLIAVASLDLKVPNAEDDDTFVGVTLWRMGRERSLNKGLTLRAFTGCEQF